MKMTRYICPICGSHHRLKHEGSKGGRSYAEKDRREMRKRARELWRNTKNKVRDFLDE